MEKKIISFEKFHNSCDFEKWQRENPHYSVINIIPVNDATSIHNVEMDIKTYVATEVEISHLIIVTYIKEEEIFTAAKLLKTMKEDFEALKGNTGIEEWLPVQDFIDHLEDMYFEGED